MASEHKANWETEDGNALILVWPSVTHLPSTCSLVSGLSGSDIHSAQTGLSEPAKMLAWYFSCQFNTFHIVCKQLQGDNCASSLQTSINITYLDYPPYIQFFIQSNKQIQDYHFLLSIYVIRFYCWVRSETQANKIIVSQVSDLRCK